MKITKNQLKQIIKEELSLVMKEGLADFDMRPGKGEYTIGQGLKDAGSLVGKVVDRLPHVDAMPPPDASGLLSRLPSMHTGSAPGDDDFPWHQYTPEVEEEWMMNPENQVNYDATLKRPDSETGLYTGETDEDLFIKSVGMQENKKMKITKNQLKKIIKEALYMYNH